MTSSSTATIRFGLILFLVGLRLAAYDSGHTRSADRAVIDRSKLVDLTYALDRKSVV